MSGSDESWSEVGDQFKKLGSIFRRHYEERGASEVEEAGGDVEAAVSSAVESIKQAFGAVSDSVTDPEMKEEARQTAGSFLEALGATFSDLGKEITEKRDSGAT